MMSPAAEVSVIIPTLFQHEDGLLRAIRSASDQTSRPLEILVVDDRPTPKETHLPLGHAGVPIRIVANDSGQHGPSAARNYGARVARGTWIAFLDDDDEWMPAKLEKQLDVIKASARPLRTIAASRAEVRAPGGTWTTPEDLPQGDEPLVDYLFRQPDLLRATSRGIATPTIVAPREVFSSIRFDEELSNWEDTDWLMRATDAGVQLCIHPGILAIIHHNLGAAPSLSYRAESSRAKTWAEAALAPRSPVAYRNFLLTYVVRYLIDEGNRRSALALAVRTTISGHTDLRAVLKAGAALLLSDAATARLAGLSRGSFRGVGARVHARRET